MKRGFILRLFWFLTIVGAGFAQTGGDEAIWQDFLKWLDALPPNSRPMDPISTYRDAMLRRGIPAAEADRRLQFVSGFVFNRPDGVKLLWNKVYAGKDPIFIQGPTALLVSAVEGKPKGKSLDVGMGGTRSSWRWRGGISQVSTLLTKEFASPRRAHVRRIVRSTQL